METTTLKDVANELPLLKTSEQREKLLAVVGALVLRRISLSKAAAIMDMKNEAFLTLLDALGMNYSFLEKDDILVEKTW